jgi:hypothetical protein
MEGDAGQQKKALEMLRRREESVRKFLITISFFEAKPDYAL